MTQRRRILKAGLGAVGLSAMPLRFARGQGAVKVGVLLPTTGVLAAAGQAGQRGVELAAQMLRQSGAAPMEILFVDTESKPENGRVAAERLIREGAVALIGAIDSGATIAAAQVAEASKVPLVVNVASAPQITERGYTQIFRNFMPSTDLIEQAVDRIKELLAAASTKPQTAVMLYVNDTFGQTASKAAAALWEKSGIPIRIRDQIGYDLRARDLSVEVAKAKALNPDVVLTINRVNDGILIVQEMVKQSFSPMGIISPGGPGSYEKPFTDTLGKYSNDVLNAVPWYDMKNPRTEKVLAAFDKAHPGQRFELNTAFSFEALEIVANALSRAKAPTAAAVHAALRTTDIQDHITTGGPIRFDAKGQNTNIRSALLQNRDQKPIVVGPASLAVAPARFPMVPFGQR